MGKGEKHCTFLWVNNRGKEQKQNALVLLKLKALTIRKTKPTTAKWEQTGLGQRDSEREIAHKLSAFQTGAGIGEPKRPSTN